MAETNVEVTFTRIGVEAQIKTEMIRRREWLNIWYGPRCEDFEETCIVCRVHKNQDDMEAMLNVA